MSESIRSVDHEVIMRRARELRAQAIRDIFRTVANLVRRKSVGTVSA